MQCTLQGREKERKKRKFFFPRALVFPSSPKKISLPRRGGGGRRRRLSRDPIFQAASVLSCFPTVLFPSFFLSFLLSLVLSLHGDRQTTDESENSCEAESEESLHRQRHHARKAIEAKLTPVPPLPPSACVQHSRCLHGRSNIVVRSKCLIKHT